MKMRVKQNQRLIATFNTSYSHFYYCVTYALLAICLFELFCHQVYVDAYIDRANNVTNSFQYVNTLNSVNANSSQQSVFGKRAARFLFDAFFGIDTPPIDASDFDSIEDDDEEDAPKPCNCGKY